MKVYLSHVHSRHFAHSIIDLFSHHATWTSALVTDSGLNRISLRLKVLNIFSIDDGEVAQLTPHCERDSSRLPQNPPTPFRCQVRGVGDFSKHSMAFWHSHPLHAVIIQMCRAEKVGGVWTSLSSFLCVTPWMSSMRNWPLSKYWNDYGASSSPLSYLYI